MDTDKKFNLDVNYEDGKVLVPCTECCSEFLETNKDDSRFKDFTYPDFSDEIFQTIIKRKNQSLEFLQGKLKNKDYNITDGVFDIFKFGTDLGLED